MSETTGSRAHGELRAQKSGIPERLRRELERVPKLLLIRLRSLGDSILTLPLLDALHRWRPDLELDILIESRFAPVFRGYPAIHEILCLRPRDEAGKEGWSKGRMLWEIRRRSYRAALNLHGGSTSLFFTLASGARLRIGQEAWRKPWAYNFLMPASSSIWQREKLHTVEHQLSLMRWLGLPVPETPAAGLHGTGDAGGRLEKRLAAAGIGSGRFVLIHPTATLATKQWPAENFARVADSLAERHHMPVLFTSGPAEAQVLVDVGKHASGVHRYWSDLELAELFSLIGQCRLFVGNDSGPTHAAAALRKPIVVVWGSSDYHAWHPWGAPFEAVRSDFPCMPCPGYTCAAFGKPRCILEIPVGRVLDACDRMLAVC